MRQSDLGTAYDIQSGKSEVSDSWTVTQSMHAIANHRHFFLSAQAQRIRITAVCNLPVENRFRSRYVRSNMVNGTFQLPQMKYQACLVSCYWPISRGPFLSSDLQDEGRALFGIKVSVIGKETQHNSPTRPTFRHRLVGPQSEGFVKA